MANEFRIKNGLIVGNSKQMSFSGTTGKLTIGSDLTSTIDETVRDEALLHLITNNDDSDGDGVVSYDMIIERLMGDADSPNNGPNLVLMSSNTDNSADSGNLDMVDDTNIGQLLWRAHTDSSEANFGQIRVNIQDATNNAKDSKMFFKVQKANTITEFLTLDGGSDKVVVPNSGFQIGSGATVTTIDTGTSLSTSNTTLSTTGAIKSYVDTSVGAAGGGDITSVQDGNGLTGGADSGGVTLTVGAGNGITVNTNDVAVTAAQTTITSVINASLAVGRDTHNQIKFSTDDQIIFRVGNADGVTFKASGEIEATKFDGALEGNADTATKLAATANINSVAFDGSGDITITAAGSTLSDTVTVAKGGSGQTSYTNGQLLIGNTTGNTLAKATLTAGSGISVTNGAGSITIAATGGGASAIGELSDAITTATSNIGLGSGALDSLTASNGNYNVALGINAGTAITTGDRNISIGYGAGDGYDAENDNIAIGYDALGGAVNGGEKNVAIGNYSLDALTTADHNIAIGYNAGGLIVDGGSNVVIGSEAAGNGDIGANNVLVGMQAGYGSTDATQSVAIGNDAGKFGLKSATGSISMGQNALKGHSSNTTGANYNTALGHYSMEDVTTGDDNTAVGSYALTNITTATGNVAVGHDAGKSITTGGHNIAIGHQALDAVSTNGQNVAIGMSALGLCTSGNNVAVGADAGRVVTSGGQNVFVGYATGYYATSSANTLVGYGAGDNVTTGGNNTLLGVTAGGAINSGTDNIMLGRNAGDNITSGDNNVIIGAIDADSGTADDQLIIASGDGGVTWIKGDSNGGIASKAQVVAVSSNTTLAEAQSGSYVYWTGGSCTLPTSATVGTQFTIFNNTGSSATVGLGTNNSVVSNWASNAAVADNEATSYVCVSATNWVQVG